MLATGQSAWVASWPFMTWIASSVPHSEQTSVTLSVLERAPGYWPGLSLFGMLPPHLGHTLVMQAMLATLATVAILVGLLPGIPCSTCVSALGGRHADLV